MTCTNLVGRAAAWLTRREACPPSTRWQQAERRVNERTGKVPKDDAKEGRKERIIKLDFRRELTNVT